MKSYAHTRTHALNAVKKRRSSIGLRLRILLMVVKCSWGGTMTLQESFENIKDERIERCKKHNLVDILMLVFVGVLCGYKSIEQIQFYATVSEQTLKKYLKLENGIPSSDTILRVLARIDAKQLEKVFRGY